MSYNDASDPEDDMDDYVVNHDDDNADDDADADALYSLASTPKDGYSYNSKTSSSVSYDSENSRNIEDPWFILDQGVNNDSDDDNNNINSTLNNSNSNSGYHEYSKLYGVGADLQSADAREGIDESDSVITDSTITSKLDAEEGYKADRVLLRSTNSSIATPMTMTMTINSSNANFGGPNRSSEVAEDILTSRTDPGIRKHISAATTTTATSKVGGSSRDIATPLNKSTHPYLKSRRSLTPNSSSSVAKSTASYGAVLTITSDEQVEKMVMNCIRKAEYNHKVQVSLGFIDSYVMVPARGSIIQSKPRPFLAGSDFISAFTACGVNFSDDQIDRLIKLIVNFATQFRDRTDENVIVNVTQDLGEIMRKHMVSAKWTKKYFCHLRLFERTSIESNDWVSSGASKLLRSVSAPRSGRTRTSDDFRRLSVNSYLANAAAAASTSFNADSNNNQNSNSSSNKNNLIAPQKESRKPKSFENWLVRAVLANKAKNDDKPNEFRRALIGQQHSLTNREIIKFLEENSIFPEKYLEAEIDHRIQAWISGKSELTWVFDSTVGADGIWKQDTTLDISGSFDTKMKYLIAHWESTDKKNKLSALPAAARKAFKESCKSTVVAKERQRLSKLEATECQITKSLYYDYRRYCDENKPHKKASGVDSKKIEVQKWGIWLWDSLAKRVENLKKFQTSLKKIKNISDSKLHRDGCYAAISDIEASVQLSSNSASKITQYDSVEVSKSLVKLKKAARDSHVSCTGKLVTRAQFNQFFDSILVPKKTSNLRKEMIPIVEESKQYYRELASVAPKDKENTESANNANVNVGTNSVFFSNIAQAEERQLKNDEVKKEEKVSSFDAWMSGKEEKSKEAKEKAKNAQLVKAAADAKKKKENKKAFNEWLYLRRINKYQTAAGSSLRPVPSPNPIQHATAWNQDADLKAYYARQERDTF